MVGNMGHHTGLYDPDLSKMWVPNVNLQSCENQIVYTKVERLIFLVWGLKV